MKTKMILFVLVVIAISAGIVLDSRRVIYPPSHPADARFFTTLVPCTLGFAKRSPAHARFAV